MWLGFPNWLFSILFRGMFLVPCEKIIHGTGTTASTHRTLGSKLDIRYLRLQHAILSLLGQSGVMVNDHLPLRELHCHTRLTCCTYPSLLFPRHTGQSGVTPLMQERRHGRVCESSSRTPLTEHEKPYRNVMIRSPSSFLSFLPCEQPSTGIYPWQHCHPAQYKPTPQSLRPTISQ